MVLDDSASRVLLCGVMSENYKLFDRAVQRDPGYRMAVISGKRPPNFFQRDDFSHVVVRPEFDWR